MRLGFQLVELAHVAALVEQAQHVGIAHLDADDFALRRLRGADGAGAGGMRTSKPFDLRGDLRKFGDRQLVAVGEHDGAKHRVFQLPDIARPIVAVEQRQGLGADAAQALAFLRREARGRNRRARSGMSSRRTRSGGNGDRKDIEPVIEILAERARA